MARWIKAARLRWAARAGGPWPPPLRRPPAEPVDQARRKPDLPEHQDQADADHA
ncbi:hypothetical protein GCM10010300_62160 [Streptomyces olivaceoviridis]|nr:hypothetical protein GCM10010300_62160 [Streptomyces olivaceoviridis]